MPAKPVYLDHAATTPVDPEVCREMMRYFCGSFGNPGSTHAYGTQAKEAVDVAREQVAEVIGAHPEEILWTSGATESDNLAVKGAAEALRPRGRGHLVTVATEHKAVLEPMRALERDGWLVDILPVDQTGLLDLEMLDSVVRDDTALVSVMAVNNETGVIQDIEAIGEICARSGAKFHVDAAQAFGKLYLDVDSAQVDFLSISAHKIYGPKGAGALYMRGGTECAISCQMHGGGQEDDKRSGTLNVPGIVGLGKAAELASGEDSSQILCMRERMLGRLRAGLGDVPVTAESSPRLEGLLSVYIEGVCTHDLIDLCRPVVAFSKGSACMRGKDSYVLEAMGYGPEYSEGVARMMFGRHNTMRQVDEAAKCIINTARELRGF